MADIKIDVEKATPWIKNVKEEIAAVNKTLKDVEEVCKTFPGEGDTIFQLIEKTGGMLEDTWDAATQTYKNSWELIENGIDAVSKAGAEAAAAIEDFMTNVK